MDRPFLSPLDMYRHTVKRYRLSPRVFHTWRGFTLIELMFVLWVLSLTAIHHYPVWQEYLHRRAIENTIASFETFGEIARHYKQSYGDWPTSIELAAQGLGMDANLHNRNPFGYTYAYQLSDDGSTLMVLTQTNRVSQASHICAERSDVVCSDTNIHFTVQGSATRSGDHLVRRLVSGSGMDVDVRGNYLLNVGSINSQEAGVLDFRVHDMPGTSELVLFSLDAKEIIVDDLYGPLLDDLDRIYQRSVRESLGERRNNPLSQQGRYTFFPQSRYPLRHWP